MLGKHEIPVRFWVEALMKLYCCEKECQTVAAWDDGHDGVAYGWVVKCGKCGKEFEVYEKY
jgi:hypothetical protein